MSGDGTGGGMTTCPRCGGSMIGENDRFGTYWTCLNCGNVRDEVTGPRLLDDPQQPRERSRQPRERRRQPSHKWGRL